MPVSSVELLVGIAYNGLRLDLGILILVLEMEVEKVCV